MASRLVQVGKLTAQRRPIDAERRRNNANETSSDVTPVPPTFDMKKIGVAAGVGLAAFAIVKAIRPDNNILSIAGLAIGGVVGYFGYDAIFYKKANFINATGGDCMTCCRKCKGKCSCTGNMCTCKGETILMSV